MKTVLGILGWVALVGAGFWIRDLQLRVRTLESALKRAELRPSEATATTAPPSAPLHSATTVQDNSSDPIPALRAQLAKEQAELDRLRAVAEQTGIGTDLKRARENLAKLQAQNQALGGDGRIVDERSRQYRDRQHVLARASRTDLQRRKQTVEQRLRAAHFELDQRRREHGHDFKAELALRQSEVDNLRAERDDIERQLRRLSNREHGVDAAITEEVRQEKGEVGQDRADVERQILGARAEVERLSQARELEALRAQEIKVEGLNAALGDALSEKSK